MGFEYGYTIVANDALVMWEAQFGDFANALRYHRTNSLRLRRISGSSDHACAAIAHGYEGQGPEHSSARLERISTALRRKQFAGLLPDEPAQYFTCCAASETGAARVRSSYVMTPKSLLRLPAATPRSLSSPAGGFVPSSTMRK